MQGKTRATVDRCHLCGERATLLCDGILGYLKKPDLRSGRYVIDTKAEKPVFTCDRPMCRGCVARSNNIFFDGRERWIDTVDYCPECERQERWNGLNAPLVTQREGEILQRQRLLHSVHRGGTRPAQHTLF